MRHALDLLRALLLMIGCAAAQAAVAAPSCAVPGTLTAPHREAASDKEPARRLPIGGYTLSVIWMPGHCREDASEECAQRRTMGRTMARGANAAIGASPDFMLHGLWPDGRGKDWPQWCRPADPLPAAVIAGPYCATPSPQLIQHEWAKHGTCMAGYTPDRYFALSNRLFAGLAMPRLRALSYRRLTARDVQTAIAGANPGMSAGMMRLNLDRKGWLKEIWFCLDTDFRRTVCSASAGGASPNDRVMIWRGGRRADAGSEGHESHEGQNRSGFRRSRSG
ncbi:ribonuclease T2 family protein [Sphingomonas bacterium]|uniref:ribonuclease T2 family protein n=1 Tax=Sphingomonas bacterium TaxID=1895847 RepID=UPI00157579B4|nr:ribonuclease T [Sphingomonas bacterium]